MVSFEVVTLFTSVLNVDSIELLIHHFEDNILTLFIHVQTSTGFGQFCEQWDGVTMGLKFSSVIANFSSSILRRKQ
jgi:hypothetical protein